MKRIYPNKNSLRKVMPLTHLEKGGNRAQGYGRPPRGGGEEWEGSRETSQGSETAQRARRGCGCGPDPDRLESATGV